MAPVSARAQDWEWVPVADTPAAVRFAYRVFGVDRVRRWVVRVDWFLDREPRPAKPRCEWTTPATKERCVADAGHRGHCTTLDWYTNRMTGKTFSRDHYWYGINYDVVPRP